MAAGQSTTFTLTLFGGAALAAALGLVQPAVAAGPGLPIDRLSAPLSITQPALVKAQATLAEQEAIVAVIQTQLDAMRRDDASGAFSQAAPTIQARFGDPTTFMSMVRQGYGVLIKPRTIEFLDMREVGGRPMQAVAVTGQSGDRVIAIYEMEKQADGAWRIAGCVLTRDTRPEV